MYVYSIYKYCAKEKYRQVRLYIRVVNTTLSFKTVGKKTFPSNHSYINTTQTSQINAASGCRCIIQYLFPTPKTTTSVTYTYIYENNLINFSNQKLAPIRQNYIFIYGLNNAKKITIQVDINLTKYINKLFVQDTTYIYTEKAPECINSRITFTV
jgi:hypothetical protein